MTTTVEGGLDNGFAELGSDYLERRDQWFKEAAARLLACAAKNLGYPPEEVEELDWK